MRVDKISAHLPYRANTAAKNTQKSDFNDNKSAAVLPLYGAFLGSIKESSPCDRAKLTCYNSQKAIEELNRLNQRVQSVDAIARINIDSAYNEIGRIQDGAYKNKDDEFSNMRIKVSKDETGSVKKVRQYMQGQLLRELDLFDDGTIKISNYNDNTITFANDKREPLKWLKASQISKTGEVESASETILYHEGKIKQYTKKGDKTSVINYSSDYKKDNAVLFKNVKGTDFIMPEKCDYICTSISQKADDSNEYFIKSYLEDVDTASNRKLEAKSAIFYGTAGLNPGADDFTSALIFEEPVSYHENLCASLDENYCPKKDVTYGLSMKNTADDGFVQI